MPRVVQGNNNNKICVMLKRSYFKVDAILKGLFTIRRKCVFAIRLAGFMNLKKFSLEIKWPILMQKRRVFVVV